MTWHSLAHEVVVGVDAHKDVHVAAAVDDQGRLLGYRSVATTARGCSELHAWALELAPGVRCGVEGTGSYGAGLSRYLRAQGSTLVEIRGPNRKLRRDRGKSDTTDAEAAARAVLAEASTIVPKAGDNWVEQLRTLSDDGFCPTSFWMAPMPVGQHVAWHALNAQGRFQLPSWQARREVPVAGVAQQRSPCVSAS